MTDKCGCAQCIEGHFKVSTEPYSQYYSWSEVKVCKTCHRIFCLLHYRIHVQCEYDSFVDMPMRPGRLFR